MIVTSKLLCKNAIVKVNQSSKMRVVRNFASDNNSGACPEVLEVMEECNREHAAGYGDDIWTRRASDALLEVFQTDCEVFFVFNGTAANSLALTSKCRSNHSILCNRLAHLETDECGAPEFFFQPFQGTPSGRGKGDLDLFAQGIRPRRIFPV